MNYLFEILKRKSTYQGILLILGALHYVMSDLTISSSRFTFWESPLTIDECIGVFMIAAGLMEIFLIDNSH